MGYDQISDVLAGRLTLGTLIVLALAKLVAWWVALGSGTSGGTLAPILLISGSFGALLGRLAGTIPGVHVSPGAFALVAMAATFGAATRAPFASIVFLFEPPRLPGDPAPHARDCDRSPLGDDPARDSIMTEKLTRRGLRVPSDYHADILRTTSVREVMTTDVETAGCGYHHW